MAKNPLRGEGVPPTSAKEKFRQEPGIFGPKTPILALFGPFYGKTFSAIFLSEGGGSPPISAKLPLAKRFSVKGVGDMIPPKRLSFKKKSDCAARGQTNPVENYLMGYFNL